MATGNVADALAGRRVVLGITGSIAAYKSAELCSRLVKRGADVRVVMTEAARRFITAETMHTLSKNPVICDLFVNPFTADPLHVDLANWMEILVVAPATANFIGKIANGLADDALTCTVMACSYPVIIAPAMNDKMYSNRIVQANIQRLRSLGYEFVDPESGRLASGRIGMGRLASLDRILQRIIETLAEPIPPSADA